MLGEFAKFLTPTREKMLFFAIFLIISIGGYIQSYAFSETGAKPAFYDAIRPVPFWEVWAFLILPLALFSWLLADFYLFALLMLAYLYLLSCLLHLASEHALSFGAKLDRSKKGMYAKALGHPHAPAFVGLCTIIFFIVLVLVALPLAQSVLMLLVKG